MNEAAYPAVVSRADERTFDISWRICDWYKSSSCNDGAYSKLLTQVFLEETQKFVYLHSVGADLITSELHGYYSQAPQSNFASSFWKQ